MSKVNVDRASFYRLMGYFRPYYVWIFVAFICALIVAGTVGVTGLIVDPVMQKVFGSEPVGSMGSLILKNDNITKFLGEPPPKGKEKDILKVSPEEIKRLEAKKWEEKILYISLIPIVIIILYINKGVFRFLQNYILRIIGEKVIRLVRLQLYEQYQRLSIDYYSDSNTGVMMSRITNDVNMMQRAVASLVSLFREPVTMIFLAGVAFYKVWYLALIIFVIFPITIYPIARFGGKIRKYTKRGQVHMGDLNTVLKENFSGIRVIKAFGMEDYEINRFQTENEKYYQATKKRIVFDELSSPVIEAIGAIGGALVIYFGGWLVLKTQLVGGHYLSAFNLTLSLTPGQLVAFIVSIGLMYEPLKKINKMNINFQSALAAAERVFEVLDQKPSVKEMEKAVDISPIKKKFKFENVRFKYDAEWILDNIDISVAAGQSVALVGSSGAGKTTFVNLIPRFYDPNEGGLLIDGVDIRKYTFKSLRSQIGMVTQETFLFADTVANNIAYGHHDADKEEIIETARAAYAHDFIVELENGYDTMIGELGVKLSGGQRQRLAIARALFKDAPILILDEATSALDTESEQKVQAALENLMKGRTTFVIAHRLSTIRNADRILVLEKGRIVEDGSHDMLLGKNGEYARLYNIQFSDKK